MRKRITHLVDGTPWIMIEFDKPGIPGVGDGFIGLTFREGVTFEQAKEIARELRENFQGMSHTQFLR
jgi:hypothetical protein